MAFAEAAAAVRFTEDKLMTQVGAITNIARVWRCAVPFLTQSCDLTEEALGLWLQGRDAVASLVGTANHMLRQVEDFTGMTFDWDTASDQGN
eukprot:7356812-Pyramimonas_sp.AAC.1